MCARARQQIEEAKILEAAQYKELEEIGKMPLFNSPVCRGIVVCISTGNETDIAMSDHLEQKVRAPRFRPATTRAHSSAVFRGGARAAARQVKENFGDLIAYCHNYLGKAFDPEEDESDDLEDPGLPFFEGPRRTRARALSLLCVPRTPHAPRRARFVCLVSKSVAGIVQPRRASLSICAHARRSRHSPSCI